MKMDNRHAAEVIARFNAGMATDQEKELIKQWLMFGDFPELMLSENEMARDLLEVGRRLPLAHAPAKKKIFKLWKTVAVAASLIIVSGLAWYVSQRSGTSEGIERVAYTDDVQPGSNKAILTLADGRKLNLADVETGELAQQDGIHITKLADGRLRYFFSNAGKASSLYNSLSTPPGGQHEVILPDGTHVWLNAASSIRFPVSFEGRQTRRVEVTGEAYFEVAKRSGNVPFIVKTATQEVEVLGTHFNVNAYGDGGKVKTTLLEGRVRVSAAVGAALLNPGQQAVLSADKLTVLPVDTAAVMAWRNGLFIFNGERLEDILLGVGRWYHVEVVFEKDVAKDETFWGVIKRSVSLKNMLDLFEHTNKVHFKVEGRRITVMKDRRE